MPHAALYSLSETLILLAYETGKEGTLVVARASGLQKLLESETLDAFHRWELTGQHVLGELTNYGTILEASTLGQRRQFHEMLERDVRSYGYAQITARDLHAMATMTGNGLVWAQRVKYRFEYRITSRSEKFRVQTIRNTKTKYSTQWLGVDAMRESTYEYMSRNYERPRKSGT